MRTLQTVATTFLITLSATAAVWADGPVKVACIGDSITNFAMGSGREKAYPAQLQEKLGEGFDVENFGVSGATMLKKGDLPYWGLKAFTDAKEFQPDIVTIKLGTNDSKPQNWNAEAYEADYRAMIAALQALDSKPKVILCRPVPAFSEAFGIRNTVILGEGIPIVDTLGAEFHLPVVDLYNALQPHGDTFPDGIHPNAEGSEIIAKVLAEEVKKVAGSKKD